MAGRSSKGKLRGMLSDKVRVWWPPTKDRKKTDFSGMYWPAKVVKHTSEGYEVQYDNGDREMVLSENVSPFTPPVKFGEEGCALQVGEFCEVSNGSKTDPAAWVGKVKRLAKRGTYTVSYPFHDAPDEHVKPEMVRRARVYDSHIRQWALITPAQEWEDGEVSSPVELEQCDEETLADILGTEARVLVTRRGSQGQGPASPLAGRLTAMRQQAQAAASSKKEASTSGPAAAAWRTRKASASDEQTGDSARSGKKAKKEETAGPAGMPLPASSGGNPIAGYITHHVPGLGPVLIPLSSVMASGALSSHVNATLQSLSQQEGGGQQGDSASPHPHPHPAHMLPSAPLLPASSAHHRPQQATVDQIMQQAAAFASTTSGAATTAGRGRQEGSYPNVGSTSLAALVPHVPQVAPPPHAAAVLASAAAKSEASAPSAVMEPCSPRTHAQAAASLAEAATRGEGQEGEGEGKKEKRTRKKKDPAAPKKALTAYLVFINSKREQIIREHPTADLKDQVRLLAGLWRQISPEEKLACEASAAQDCNRYAIEKAKYEMSVKQEAPTSPPPWAPPTASAPLPSVVPQVNSPSTMGKAKKNADAPKRPRTAYILFSMEFRKTLNSLIGFNDGTKLAAEAWNKAGEAEKAPHVAAAAREKEQYERLCDEYTEKKDAATAAAAMNRAKDLLSCLGSDRCLQAAQVPAAEASAPAAPAPAPAPAPAHLQAPAAAAAAAEAAHSSVGPDELILQDLDLAKAKPCLTRAGFHPTVYYMLVDVWRSGSDRLPDAIRSYKTHVASRKSKPDWKGFVIGIFGLETLAPLLNKKSAMFEDDAVAAKRPDGNSY